MPPSNAFAPRTSSRRRLNRGDYRNSAEFSQNTSTMTQSAIVTAKSLSEADTVSLLIAKFQDPRLHVRKRALVRVVTFGASAVEPLLKALSIRDRRVRFYSVTALGQIGDGRCVEPLVRMLKDNWGWEPLYAAIANIGKPAEPALLRLAKEEKCIAAWEVLGLLNNKKGLEVLLRNLQHANNHYRRSAVAALSRINNPKATDGLIVALRDSDPGVRLGAASALRQRRDAIAREPLIESLTDSDDHVRRTSIEALGAIGGESILLSLIELLKHDDPSTRWRAAEALGSLGSQTSIRPLIDALLDENRAVRWRAARALGRLGDNGALEPLIQCLNDDDIYVRRHARNAALRIVLEIEFAERRAMPSGLTDG